jgi:aminoglycoside phosphotransferase (APT) family kinase protein
VLHDRVHKVVRLGHWFEAVDAPTIRLAPGVDQPVSVGRLLASVWRYVPETTPEPTVGDLGRVLWALHALAVPDDLALPAWDPVDDARRRLTDAEALDDADRATLEAWCDDLAPQVADLNARAGDRLVHGDAHVGNLLRTPGGGVVIADFDATCRGPWQVDLVPVAVGEQRFGRAGAHAALVAAYGHDVTTDPDWPLLRRARELKMVAAAVPLLASTPGVAAEFRTRLDSIRRGDDNTRWTPYADLRRSA